MEIRKDILSDGGDRPIYMDCWEFKDLKKEYKGLFKLDFETEVDMCVFVSWQ